MNHAGLVHTAQEIREAYEALSPMIESYTSSACPDCGQVCCIDRHAALDPADLEFIRLVDSDAIPMEPPLIDDKRPCRYLEDRGCVLQRWRRPYSCTWYFCETLLERMHEDGSRRYRQMLEALQRVGRLRGQMLGP